jgi:hypothetical protein
MFQTRNLTTSNSTTVSNTPSNLVSLHLDIAIHLLKKINMAASYLPIFFPTKNTYVPSPPQHVASLSTIVYTISTLITSMSTHLSFLRTCGVPVNPNIEFFEQSIHRLILLTSMVTNDVDYLRAEHIHPKNKKSVNTIDHFDIPRRYGLIDRNVTNWRRHLATNPALRDYLQVGRDTAQLLIRIDELMSEYLRNCGSQICGDWISGWLAKELNRILGRTGKLPDTQNEFAVIDFAWSEYQLLLERDNESQKCGYKDVRVERFCEDMKRVVYSGTWSDELDEQMYKLVGQFYQDRMRPDNTRVATTAETREANVQNFCVVVELAVGLAGPPVTEEPRNDQFTAIIKFMREKEPAASPNRIIAMAKRMYNGPERDLFGEQSSQNVSEAIEKVQAAQDKQERRRRRMEKDRIHKVLERITRKRQGKIERVASSLRNEM